MEGDFKKRIQSVNTKQSAWNSQDSAKDFRVLIRALVNLVALYVP